MGVFPVSQTTEKKYQQKVKRLVGRFIPGKYGLSLYVGKREVFIGIEIAKVIIVPKIRKPKRLIKSAKTEWVPIRE